MRPTKPLALLTFGALLLAVISSTADSRNSGFAGDQVIASFEREFNHKTMPATAATRVAINSDELYKLVNKPLQSAEEDVRGEL